MKLARNALPTVSAIAIAQSVGLLPAERKSNNIEEYDNALAKLTQFQQMSLVADVESSTIAYFGVELDSDQERALDLIYSTTQPWLLGHVIGELLELLSSDKFDNKNAVAAAQLIVNSLMEDGVVDKENAAQLIIKLAPQVQTVEANENAA